MYRTRCAILLFLILASGYLWTAHRPPGLNQEENPYQSLNLIWGVARRAFIISLPWRDDRRRSLTPLLRAHNLRIQDSLSPLYQNSSNIQTRVNYVPATESNDLAISHILAHLRAQRHAEYKAYRNGTPLFNSLGKKSSFNNGLRKHPHEEWGSDLWALPLAQGERSQVSWDDLLDPDESYDIPCEKGNPFNLKKFARLDSNPTTASNLRSTDSYITRAMVACWHSHVQVIRHIALLGRDIEEARPETFIVLEDDIDFEWDIQSLLMQIWDALPTEWEIVMLGHCWSDEARYPALVITNFTSPDPSGSNKPFSVSLHPSNSPLCTHAYALSPAGAKRIYNLLRHPAFAYSRPLDQALAWLIRSGLLKQAYSVVPSLIVQTKDGKSDISERKGSRWRDKLMDSTKDRVRGKERSWLSWRWR